ncbi:hypothetical protein TRP8649_00484 [Pelagimonas phthalicica]|uniref:Uncharacterized protein n=1 Tax=Pelagimonas phthalicica TaxID=1037362 RepID=A0A238J8A8_9RHOB|nr:MULTISPECIES: hypothetical protein [Roseobacteraceae]MBO9464048.1 hypothetical protein [Tropicibacter sp. R15_0]TDS95067.1 hypothetical protein CLV87_1587 [Pelagimonas phthalicica]SMX26407.1 hypothetical protein TRP8649_00484 [Pelagimonas phthalicica]
MNSSLNILNIALIGALLVMAVTVQARETYLQDVPKHGDLSLISAAD